MLLEQGHEGLLVVMLQLGNCEHAGVRLQLPDWLKEPESVKIRRMSLQKVVLDHHLLFEALPVWPLQIFRGALPLAGLLLFA